MPQVLQFLYLNWEYQNHFFTQLRIASFITYTFSFTKLSHQIPWNLLNTENGKLDLRLDIIFWWACSIFDTLLINGMNLAHLIILSSVFPHLKLILTLTFLHLDSLFRLCQISKLNLKHVTFNLFDFLLLTSFSIAFILIHHNWI